MGRREKMKSSNVSSKVLVVERQFVATRVQINERDEKCLVSEMRTGAP